MFSTYDAVMLSILIISSILSLYILSFLKKKKKKTQLTNIFIILFRLVLFWMICSCLQIIFTTKFNIDDKLFVNLAYISICFLPVAFFFMALIFARTKITFKGIYCFLFVIPIISLIVLWTNDFHHIFFQQYSSNIFETVYGWYLYVHTFYTYGLFALSLILLLKYSAKNSGFFSRQAILIFIGASLPIITNILGAMKIISMSIYITPITFAFTIICLTFAIFRFDLFKSTPIALQRIVDRISDSYVVLNENYEISDFNQTLITTFHIRKPDALRGMGFLDFLAGIEVKNNSDQFIQRIMKVENTEMLESFELYISKYRKYFNIEITSIIVNKQFLGILILFKDITQHIKDMQSLKDNQSMLMEQERLASLGQMIGGIAHNLKTPIMSISGASEGLKDLVNEFDASIGNPVVNNDDFHDIAKDMRDWLTKINSYTEYMSDILTAVKGQAVNLSEQEQMDFTLGELFKRVNILMKHELKQAVVYLNTSMKVDENIIINGDVNSLVQVINNMISNSIQAYKGEPEQQIDLM